jgi:hypothetical protein
MLSRDLFICDTAICHISIRPCHPEARFLGRRIYALAGSAENARSAARTLRLRTTISRDPSFLAE